MFAASNPATIMKAENRGGFLFENPFINQF
jgi:hypothetical protein